ncbi:MAG: hypothetical protein IPH94_19200 [Saprospiraceae bacterium]|nr:hypothetical protein [Saprospiraceae bacterium]
MYNNTNFGSGSISVGTGRTITINGSFQVNVKDHGPDPRGTWNYASGSSLIFNNSFGPYGPPDGNHVYWPPTSGPINVSVQNGGGIIMGVSRTVGGTFTLVTGTNAVQGTALKLNGDVLTNGGNSSIQSKSMAQILPSLTILAALTEEVRMECQWSGNSSSTPGHSQLGGNQQQYYPQPSLMGILPQSKLP